MGELTPQRTVRKRRVLYVPGYDPVPPRKYRERYRTQSAKQAEISGYQIALGPKQGDGRFGWHVSAVIDDAAVDAEIEVLYWSDIVRKSMGQGVLSTYMQLARTAWAYIGSGALFSLMKLRKGPMIAALYPVVVLLLQLAVAVAALALIPFAARALAPQGWGAMVTGVGGALGALAAWRWLIYCQRRDHLLAWYLMHDYAFSAQGHGAYPPAKEARIAAFTDRVATALGDDVDEVLLVGHSSGAYLAVSILADLIRAGRMPPGAPTLSLLTLGHVVPMISFLPDAHRLRADLAYLSQSDALTWVDVTAPGDGCSFALCDPVAVSGVAPQGKRWPLVLSAAFSQTLRPETWKALRWRFFELHFQYLNAFDNPGSYDYFQITAGPLTLADRFADRSPSQGRIEAPVNRYTDQAA